MGTKRPGQVFAMPANAPVERLVRRGVDAVALGKGVQVCERSLVISVLAVTTLEPVPEICTGR